MVRPRLDAWPPAFASVQAALQAASDAVLAGFAGLRAVEAGQGDLVEVFRALRHLPRAQEALYPLAAKFPPVSEFFLAPERRGDPDLLARLQQPPGDHGGIFHDANEPGSRGGFSVYVPEYYAADRDWPLVMALHGGSGNGRGFLWSWLREARGDGAIVVAPTATGPTWALMGDDADTPNLQRILDRVQARWRIDPARLLLTGMSDGGTFCYVSGLQAEFAFHPSGAGRCHLSSADGGGCRSAAAAKPADPHHPWPARLDVSGADRARCRAGADRGRRSRQLLRDRRSQPLLSARDQSGLAALARRREHGVRLHIRGSSFRGARSFAASEPGISLRARPCRKIPGSLAQGLAPRNDGGSAWPR